MGIVFTESGPQSSRFKQEEIVRSGKRGFFSPEAIRERELKKRKSKRSSSKKKRDEESL